MIILVVSDVHDNLNRLAALARREDGADLVVVSGDLTQFGRATRVQQVLEAFAEVFPSVLAIPGNMDHRESLSVLESTGRSLHARSVVFGGVGLAGMGASPPTPFGTPFELPEEDIERGFTQAALAVETCPVRVFVSHAPPRDTALDRVWGGGHVGSAAVRRVVEKFQPDVLACGHIHEAAGIDRLGRTMLANPGPFSQGGYVRITVGAETATEIRQL